MAARVSTLSWLEVGEALSPRAQALTGPQVAALALPHVPARRPAQRLSESHFLSDVTRTLCAQLGPWAAGWCWSAGEGGGGGPVQGWCCVGHSVWSASDTGPEPTAARVAQGLLSWRDWIRELSVLFASAPPEVDAVQAFEQLAHRVLARVVERTGAEDAWYVHAEQVLGWFLESRGVAQGERWAHRAMKGHYESWVSPDEAQAAQTVAVLRDGYFRSRPHVEGLAAWWRTRASTPWASLAPAWPAAEGHDGVLESVLRRELEVDEARAERLLEAHQQARAHAQRRAPLTVAELVRWQSVLLGRSTVALRTQDAWAKEGRERYERVSDLEARLEAVVAGANDEALSPVARAARVYLDLCFLHPFDDGNARAARVALDFVLTRAGLVLADEEGWAFRLPLAADDPGLGCSFEQLLTRLARKGAP